MCGGLSKNLGLSSSLKTKQGEEAMVSKKQGIVSVLEPDSDESSSIASLRRTLSADMSSKKWLSENGFLSTMKKSASSRGFSLSDTNSSSSSSEDDEEEQGKARFDIWDSMQEEKNANKSVEGDNGGPFYIWGSIMFQKAEEDSVAKPLPPPYVHPLVRRSSNSLSGKSLAICTESLGSETGSDVFSSYPSSEMGDGELVKEERDSVQEQQEPVKQELREWSQEKPVIRTVKSSSLADKKPSQRSFPPPLSSLARQDGESTYMRTRRDNGRLVLEAVAVPSKNNFCAQRQGGRLVLSFAKAKEEEEKDEERWEEMEEKNHMEEEEEEEEEEESSEEEIEGNNDDEEEEIEMGFMVEKVSTFSSGLMSVHRLLQMVNKPMDLANRNPTMYKEKDETTAMVVEKQKPKAPLAQSLPPRPPTTAKQTLSPAAATANANAASAAVSLNVYEPYWRPKSLSKIKKPEDMVFHKKNRQQEGGGDLVVKGCKDQRRSMLFWGWEPYPIAT